MRRFWAGLMAIVVVPLLAAALVFVSLRAWILDPGFYATALADQRLYEPMTEYDVPLYLSEQIVYELPSSFPARALATGLAQVMDSEYLRDQALRLLEGVFDALEGRSPHLTLTLDVLWLKEQLQGSGSLPFAQAVASHLPICSSQRPTGGGNEYLQCVPAGQAEEQTIENILRQLPSFVAEMPDELLVAQETDWIQVPASSVFTIGLVVSVLVIAGLWFMTALVGGYDWPERLHWLGWTLVFPTFTVFLAGLAMLIGLALGWTFWIGSGMVEHTIFALESFRVALAEVASIAGRVVARGLLVVGGVGVGIGLGMFAWSATLQARSRQY